MSNTPRPSGAYPLGDRLVVDVPALTGRRAAQEVTARARSRQVAQLRTLVDLAERHGRDATALRQRLDALVGEAGPRVAQGGRTGTPAGDHMGAGAR